MAGAGNVRGGGPGGGLTGENQRDGGGRVARQGLINDENVLYGFFCFVLFF